MAQALQALCTFSERKFRLNSTAEGSHTSILSEKTRLTTTGLAVAVRKGTSGFMPADEQRRLQGLLRRLVDSKSHRRLNLDIKGLMEGDDRVLHRRSELAVIWWVYPTTSIDETECRDLEDATFEGRAGSFEIGHDRLGVVLADCHRRASQISISGGDIGVLVGWMSFTAIVKDDADADGKGRVECSVLQVDCGAHNKRSRGSHLESELCEIERGISLS